MTCKELTGLQRHIPQLGIAERVCLFCQISGAGRWSVDTWLVRTGAFFSKKGLISEMVSCGAWARAGPIRAHMGPKGPCMNRPSVDLPCSSTR